MYDYSTKHEGEGVGAWEMLSVASVQADETAFIIAAKRIDWDSRTEQEYVEGIRMALSAGAHRFARELATMGYRRYPASEQLRKIDKILAPPRVTPIELRVNKDERQANRTWLKANATTYYGQWVALRHGKLLACGQSVADVKDCLDDTGGVLITHVL